MRLRSNRDHRLRIGWIRLIGGTGGGGTRRSRVSAAEGSPETANLGRPGLVLDWKHECGMGNPLGHSEQRIRARMGLAAVQSGGGGGPRRSGACGPDWGKKTTAKACACMC